MTTLWKEVRLGQRSICCISFSLTSHTPLRGSLSLGHNTSQTHTQRDAQKWAHTRTNREAKKYNRLLSISDLPSSFSHRVPQNNKQEWHKSVFSFHPWEWEKRKERERGREKAREKTPCWHFPSYPGALSVLARGERVVEWKSPFTTNHSWMLIKFISSQFGYEVCCSELFKLGHRSHFIT